MSIERRNKIKKTRLLLAILLLIGSVFISVVFFMSRKKYSKAICNDIEVNIEGANFLVEKQEILNIVKKVEPKLNGSGWNSFSTESLEAEIDKNSFVAKSEVYLEPTGKLSIDIIQKKPLLRIINAQNKSFYVDVNGAKMPISPNWAPRVIVANGYINERYNPTDSLKSLIGKQIFEVASFISKNEFWKAQIEQIYVNAEYDIEIIPRIGDHKIILGNSKDLETKMNNLLVFYKKVLPRVGWNIYKEINLKFNNQVIGVKKD